MRLLEQGPEVSLLLRSAQVECRPSLVPPIAWPHSPPAEAFLASVESRIALDGKTSNSGNGLPKLRCRPDLMQLRSMAIQLLATAMLAAPAQTAAPESVTISDCYDGDTCRTTDGERIRMACIDTPELGESGLTLFPRGLPGITFAGWLWDDPSGFDASRSTVMAGLSLSCLSTR